MRSYEIVKFKSNLILKGFRQSPEFRFNETMPLVAREVSINTILEIAAAEDLKNKMAQSQCSIPIL